MTTVPVPRFDLLEVSEYASLSVQYSRGCPFKCEFCDIIEIFGRKPRVKTPEQVIDELEAIYRSGYKGTLFFVDDNFIGNKPAVKRLLPILGDWQRKRGHPFELYTEASVDLATDPQLLHGMVDAGFSSVFLGIETPSIKALAQAKKLQNLRLDPSEAIDRITRAGIEVMGGFIVGFDSDGPEIFAQQREFLERQPVPLAMVGILTALPGTALWRRLKAEGRLRQRSNGDPFSRPNFAPAMSEEALLRGYAELMAWLYSPEEYYGRCEAYLRRVGSVSASRASTLGKVGVCLRAIWHVGVRSPRRRLFWRLLGRALLRGQSKLRQAVVHAVQGEHLINYTREHVVPRMEAALAEARAEVEASRMAQRTSDTTPKWFDSSPADGASRPAHRSTAPAAHRSTACEQTRTCERHELMIKLLRNSQRRHVRRGEQEVWRSFFSEDPPGLSTVASAFCLPSMSCGSNRTPAPSLVSRMKQRSLRTSTRERSRRKTHWATRV
jgi:hypothetical protein